MGHYYEKESKSFFYLSLSKEYGKTPWLGLSMTAGGIGEVVSIGFLTLTSAALSSGFGIGLERLIQWMSGIRYIREVIPFPRMINRIYP